MGWRNASKIPFVRAPNPQPKCHTVTFSERLIDCQMKVGKGLADAWDQLPEALTASLFRAVRGMGEDIGRKNLINYAIP
jgi:hypothetical protein